MSIAFISSGKGPPPEKGAPPGEAAALQQDRTSARRIHTLRSRATAKAPISFAAMLACELGECLARVLVADSAAGRNVLLDTYCRTLRVMTFAKHRSWSLRVADGGRKNVGSGIGKARHGLQFARDHCLSIARRTSNHVNPCQKHIRFQNYSVVWTDCTRGDLRNRKQHLEGKTHADIFKLLCCLDRLHTRTFAKTLCGVCAVQTHFRFSNYSRKLDRLHTRTFAKKARQPGQIAHTYYLWGSVVGWGVTLTPAGLATPALPAGACRTSRTAGQQCCRSAVHSLALKARPPACFHPLDLGGTRSKKG